jgi:hypothetical protein
MIISKRAEPTVAAEWMSPIEGADRVSAAGVQGQQASLPHGDKRALDEFRTRAAARYLFHRLPLSSRSLANLCA